MEPAPEVFYDPGLLHWGAGQKLEALLLYTRDFNWDLHNGLMELTLPQESRRCVPQNTGVALPQVSLSPGALCTPRGGAKHTAGRGKAPGGKSRCGMIPSSLAGKGHALGLLGTLPQPPCRACTPSGQLKCYLSKTALHWKLGPRLLGERAPSLAHKSCQVHRPNPTSGLGGRF